jgi:hypothetical protein
MEAPGFPYLFILSLPLFDVPVDVTELMDRDLRLLIN